MVREIWHIFHYEDWIEESRKYVRRSFPMMSDAKNIKQEPWVQIQRIWKKSVEDYDLILLLIWIFINKDG